MTLISFVKYEKQLIDVKYEKQLIDALRKKKKKIFNSFQMLFVIRQVFLEALYIQICFRSDFGREKDKQIEFGYVIDNRHVHDPNFSLYYSKF